MLIKRLTTSGTLLVACVIFGSVSLLGKNDVHGSDNQTSPSSVSPIVSQLVDSKLLRGIEDVHIEGEYAFLPCREGKRLTICSLANPAKPKIVASFSDPSLGAAAGVAIHDSTLFLTSQDNQRLLVIDVAQKSAPKLLGSVVVGTLGQGILYKVAYHNGYCFVANQAEKNIFVVDVKDPKQPVVISHSVVTTEKDGPFSITIRGHHALVGTIFGSRNRLAVIDISNPQSLSVVSFLIGPQLGHFSGEFVDDLFFAVNWNDNAFMVIDVSNIQKPVLKAKLVDRRLGQPNRCAIFENRAYLPMVKGNGIAVVDIADPAKPKFLTSFSDPTLLKTYGVAISKKLLFVGAREGNSLTVFDPRRLE